MVESHQPDTERLMQQAARGDPEAVDRLLGQHRSRLRRMVAVRMDHRLAARQKRLLLRSDENKKLHSIAFSADGKTLATSTSRKQLLLWDPRSGQLAETLPDSSGTHCVAFSDDGKLIATGGLAGARVREVDGNHEVLSTPDGCFCVAFSSDGRTLATGGMEGVISIWDIDARARIARLHGHTNWIWSVAFSSDGRTLASGARDGNVRIWDLDRHHGFEVLPAKGNRWSDNTMLAVGTLELREYPDGVERHPPGEVRLWDLATSKVRRTIQWSLRHNSVAFSPDGRFLAVAGWDEFSGASGGTAGVWEVQSGQRVATIQGHGLGILSLAFSPDGKLLATGGEYGSIKLSDTSTWQERLTLRWDDHPIRDLAFSQDGELLAAGSGDEIRLWQAPKHHREVEQLLGESTAGKEDLTGMIDTAADVNSAGIVAGDKGGRPMVLLANNEPVYLEDSTVWGEIRAISNPDSVGTFHVVGFAAMLGDVLPVLWDVNIHGTVSSGTVLRDLNDHLFLATDVVDSGAMAGELKIDGESVPALAIFVEQGLQTSLRPNPNLQEIDDFFDVHLDDVGNVGSPNSRQTHAFLLIPGTGD